MKYFIIGVIVLALLLTGCSYNTLVVKRPDGTIVEGKSLVFNNSEEVVLEGKGEGWEFSFSKIGTDGTPQAEIVSDTITEAVGVIIP